MRATGGLFGVGATVAEAEGGKLVVRPRGFLLEALKLTLFSDPRVYVEGVGVGHGEPVNTAQDEARYVLSISASLR